MLFLPIECSQKNTNAWEYMKLLENTYSLKNVPPLSVRSAFHDVARFHTESREASLAERSKKLFTQNLAKVIVYYD